MARRTIFGPDMGISGWTPIDDNDDLQLAIRPVAVKDLVLPQNDGSGFVDIGNGMFAPAMGYAGNQSPSNAGNTPELMDNGWRRDFVRERLQALGIGSSAAESSARAPEPVSGSPDPRRTSGSTQKLDYVLPEEQPTNVDWSVIPMSRKSRPDPYANFKWDAPTIARDLKRDFGLTDEQALGVVGNLGHESGGFNALQEKRPTKAGSRGGWGWAQWTGPRRHAFEAYAAENSLDPSSYAANYGYLKRELETTHKNAIASLRKGHTVRGAVDSFEDSFERANPKYKHMDSRYAYANRALEAYKDRQNLMQSMHKLIGQKKSGVSQLCPESELSHNRTVLDILWRQTRLLPVGWKFPEQEINRDFKSAEKPYEKAELPRI